eukprot:m.95526 g.95526  ORF g.95526 m.95526 type:complete len:59 (-) comp12330_c0_seq3:3192-3368(-)
MSEGGYQPSALVEQLHGLPHYDLDFKPVSNKFAPDDERYLVGHGLHRLRNLFRMLFHT